MDGYSENAKKKDTSQKTYGKTSSVSDSKDRRTITDLIAEIEDDRTRDYVENRLIPQMRWYQKKASECKALYLRLMSASIALGAFIPVLAVLVEGSLTLRASIVLCSVATTAINALLSLHNYKDLWINYRNSREILLGMLYSYFNNTGKFARGTAKQKNALLIELCETEFAHEDGTWRFMQEMMKDKYNDDEERFRIT